MIWKSCFASLVPAYAMWISPAFHLKVIRAYDQMQVVPQRDSMEILNDRAAMRCDAMLAAD
jgi:hypothetical protein